MKFLLSLFLFNFSYVSLNACTGILTTDGIHVISGRTVEYGIDLDMSICVISKGTPFVGKTPKGKGLSYTSKYAAVGMTCYDEKALMDGMNEKGLVVGAFLFAGYADYTPINETNLKNALSPIDFTNWILTQFATLDEVKEAIKDVAVVPTVYKSWGNMAPPLHYIVYDSEGRSIVIEPVNQTLKIYENEIGAITNSPTFDFQLTNLGNYMNLKAENVPFLKLKKFKLDGFGQGSGMLGLPGDFTPPSRFVRAAFFSALATPKYGREDPVNETFHLLNQFDIPHGVVQGKMNGKAVYDYTVLTTVKDHKKQRYYFRSYKNQDIQYVDLKEATQSIEGIKMLPVQGNGAKTNITSKFL